MKKVMHIASFKGNTGDVINHTGFYKILKDALKYDFEIKQIEIREFYRNSLKRKFDDEFLQEVNSHDMLILGGGAFFDPRWIESKTGTTFDMDKSFIDGIEVPVLVNGMGYLELSDEIEHSNEIYDRFKDFLSYITHKDNWLVTVRNDESFERLESRYTSDITGKITKVADNGLFFKDKIKTKPLAKMKTVGMNITNDLFSEKFNKYMTIDKSNDIISLYINELIAEDIHVILFAHTPQDMNTINIIMNKMGPEKFREKVSIAPYYPSDEFGANELAKYYKLCDVVVAMRFHANILSLQMGVPTIGLAGHNQIRALYNELSLKEYYVMLDNDGFVDEIKSKIQEVSKEEYAQKVDNSFAELEKLKILYKNKLNRFLCVEE